jgi:DNA polymerase elongation subunit (family B)
MNESLFLLDVAYDPNKNIIIKWLKSGENIYRYEDLFYPTLYVSGIIDDTVQDRLKSLPYIKDINIEEKKTWLRKDPEKVSSISTSQKQIYDIASMLENRGYHTYNVDIGPVRQYLLKENIFPFAKLKHNNATVMLDDDQIYTDYSIPDLNIRELKIKSKKKKGIVTTADPIGEITFGDIIIDQGSESEIIQEFNAELINEDPDIILTDGGDIFDLPYLYSRAFYQEINIQLGRDYPNIKSCNVNKINEINNDIKNDIRKGRSYFSYGRVYYKPRKYTLSGRLHIDKSSFIYKEGGLLGIIDLARITRIPLQELSRLSPGSAVTALQVNQAIQENVLVPWKRNLAENWKTAEELLIADRGALVIEPKVGIHENTYELDFSSLFPNIMVNHNISPETVLCDCCPDSRQKVPFINYNFCEKYTGLVPRILKPLIERRMEYKKLSKDSIDKEKRKEYDMKQNILKWLLVTSFGYMGFNKARFGKIECHESITAYARDILLRTIEFADDKGFDILHGIVDCLWIKGNDKDLSVEEVEQFCLEVKKQIGITLELKGKFHWIVFLPSKSKVVKKQMDMSIGSLNRYYGLNTNGEMKVRGIEIRRSDTPELIKDLQNSIFLELAKAKTSEAFRLKIYDVIEILREYSNRVLKGDCDATDLILETRISRKCDEYTQFNNQVAALKQFKKEGVEIMPGQNIRYIITNSKSKDYMERVSIPELCSYDYDNTKYDRIKYYQFLLRAVESILLPFGYTEQRLDEIIRKRIQKNLYEYC